MDLTSFLTWLGSSGGNAIVASWVLERLAWYQKQTVEVKQYVYAGAVFVLSLAAYLVLTYVPVDVVNAIAPYFAIAYVTFTSVFAGKSFHKVDKTVNVTPVDVIKKT